MVNITTTSNALYVIPLTEPGVLSAQEMEFIVNKRQEKWAKPYVHASVHELTDHIERYPGTLLIARFYTSGEIGGFLETYNLVTGGNPAMLPSTAEEVIKSRNAQNPDTLLLFQLESYIERRGVATGLASFAADNFFPLYPNVFAYSPQGSFSFHTQFGAKPVHVFPNGRRHHTDPHVVIVRYKSQAPLMALTDEEIEATIQNHAVALQL